MFSHMNAAAISFLAAATVLTVAVLMAAHVNPAVAFALFMNLAYGGYG